MKSVEKIWAELSAKEVELSEEQKVELNAASDLKKMIGLLEADINKYDKALMDVHNAYMEFKKGYQYAEKLEGQLEMGRKTVVGQVDDLVARAKEVGVNANEIPLVKEAQDMIQRAREYKGVLAEDFGKGIR